MARKVVRQKRPVGGLEAPRNSLELPVESSQSYCVGGDNVPFSYEVRREWSRNSYPTEAKASIKKLINKEISKGPNNRRNAPSVVARLMGMDMLPLDTKSVVQQAEKKNEKPRNNSSKKEQNNKVSGGHHVLSNSNSSWKKDFDFFQHNKERDSEYRDSGLKLKKPRPREHPQEEELQKFKKEFEAWQAVRFKECSKVIELGKVPSQWLAQEALNKEKITLYANSSRITANKTHLELKNNDIVTARSHERGRLENLEYQRYRKELFPAKPKESYSLRSRTLSRDFEQSPLLTSNPKLDKSPSSTRIVILRPGPEQISDNEESWLSSSGTSEERCSIEDFLEEVRERLKSELQGKVKKGTMVRGGGIETPYSEKPPDAKQIAQRIAKQVRESVSRDLGMNLLRSESTRSYRSEFQFNGPGSPEFINRDSRRLLAERLRNVFKGETDLRKPSVACGSSKSSMIDNERARPEHSVGNFKAGGKVSCWDIVEDEPEMQTRSFRHGPDDDVMHLRDLSPRNLSRSLSAPVSGTSFGKLLLEDRHILTGAHIRRKHEAIESVTVDVKKRKKDRFNFKEKVSSFKYSFTLRGKLFGRKIQSVEEPLKYGCDSMRDIMCGPTVVIGSGERHENSTEVPPSPASVCSSIHEELWKATDHFSSASTSDLSPLEDTSVPQVFREISSNLSELRRQLSKLDANSSKEIVIDEQPLEPDMVELEDEAEAYVRDLLVASGLYDGSSEKILPRCDLLAKPIGPHIYEEVEESYKRKGSRSDESEKVDHKLLLDLSNEALSVVLGPPVNMSRFRKTVMGPAPMACPLQGRKLLNRVWEIVSLHLYSPMDKSHYSLDGIVAKDLESTPWFGLMNNDMEGLGKELESQITGDLIEEIAKDMHS